MRALAFKFGVNTKKRRQVKLWQRAATLLTAFVVMGSGLAQMALAAPGDYVWREDLVSPNSDWRSIDASSDGTKLIAAINHGSIFTSADSGATWAERKQHPVGSSGWSSVASSADGTSLVASAYRGYLYTSNDSGVTWTEHTSAGSREWWSVASSVDGMKLVALAYNGYAYTTLDGGVNWEERQSAGLREWSTVVSSDDGVLLFAGVDRGFPHISRDSGATWSPVTNLPVTGRWYGLAMTPDGSKLVAVDTTGPDNNGGFAYISDDGGDTWQQQSALGARYWSNWADGVSISADGLTVAIADPFGSDWNAWNGGYIYISRDAGASWRPQTVAGSRFWTDTWVSPDGSAILASAEEGGLLGGYLYHGTLEGPATATVELPSLPTDNKDVATAQPVAQASLAATSMACYTLKPGTVSTLGPDSLVVPEAGISPLGGVAFSLDCTSTGGSADTSITLGTSYADTSSLRVYKRAGTGPLVDVTTLVTIQNEGGKTVIRYTLTDGGAWDEDGTANSTIVDPIYIGVVNGVATTNPGAAGGSLANTGFNVYALFALAAALLISATAIWREGVKAPKRVSFR